MVITSAGRRRQNVNVLIRSNQSWIGCQRQDRRHHDQRGRAKYGLTSEGHPGLPALIVPDVILLARWKSFLRALGKNAGVGQAFEPDVRLESLTYVFTSERSYPILSALGRRNDHFNRQIRNYRN